MTDAIAVLNAGSSSLKFSLFAISAWLGLEPDDAANRSHGPRIFTAASRVAAYVLPTDEALMIERHTWRLVRKA